MNKSILAALALGVTLSSSAMADVENLGALPDNADTTNAQALGALSIGDLRHVFGVRGSIYGGLLNDNNAADFYSFTLSSPAELTFNVFTPTGSSFGNDPIVGLYNSAGTQLANDDDGGTGFDAKLIYNVLTSGTYYVAVGGFPDFDFTGGGDTNFPYDLQISVAASNNSPVPVPGAVWLFGSALVGMTAFGRKRAA